MKIDHRGIELNVQDIGTGNTALVFLHHWGGSSRTWGAVIEQLSPRYRCIAVDARGAGGSDTPANGYGTADHAGDARAVIQALGLSRYLLVGHSMGGKASQLLASQRPTGLAGVALVASSPPSPMAIDEAQRVQMKKAYASREAVEWTLDHVLLGSPVAPDVREMLIDDALCLRAPATSGWLDIGSREDFGAEVAKVDVPVLILAGELDRVDPPEVVRQHIVPRHPAAALHFLPGKGHLLPVEAPAEVAERIDDFAQTLDAARAATRG
jgi:pimeloyl-ACP methyl ester carboxylesterase